MLYRRDISSCLLFYSVLGAVSFHCRKQTSNFLCPLLSVFGLSFLTAVSALKTRQDSGNGDCTLYTDSCKQADRDAEWQSPRTAVVPETVEQAVRSEVVHVGWHGILLL